MSNAYLTGEIFLFDGFEVDTRRGQLRYGTEVIAIEPKAFELLIYFVRNQDRLLLRNELIDNVWSAQVLSDNVLTVAVTKLRKVLKDRRPEIRFIESLYGKGYRFMRQVGTVGIDGAAFDSHPDASVSSRRASRSLPSRESSAAPFVGRAPVIERLRLALENAKRGRGSLCALIGEPGIGKTRAAEAIMEDADSQGVAVWWGRCREDESMPPLWPWIQILRMCIDTMSMDRVEQSIGPSFIELARLVPSLVGAEEPSGAGEPGAVDPETARFKTFDAITDLLKLASAEQPKLLVLDDLHWADGTSLRLLAYMVAEISRSRLMLVVMLRDTERPRSDSSKRSLDYLLGHTNRDRIELTPLTSEDVEIYTAGLLGKADPELSRLVYEKSEGNPFFMTELLRLSCVEASGGVVELGLKGPALEIVRQRVLSLNAEARGVLLAASVIGRTFDLDLLNQVTGIDVDELLDVLEEAHSTGVIIPTREGVQRFSFGHGLIRKVLYEEQSIKERARVHLAIGQLLERRFEAGAEVGPDELAYHYLAGLPHRHVDKVVVHARRAAEAARELFAYDEAVSYLSRALDALHSDPMVVDPREHCSLLLSLADCQRMAPRPADAMRTYERAGELAKRKGWYSELALAAIGMLDCRHSQAWYEPYPTAMKMLNEALELLPEGERELRARVLSRLTTDPDGKKIPEMSSRANELAREVRDPVALYDVLTARLHATQGPDALEERERVAEEILALADKQRQPLWKWQALLARYDVCLRRGDRVGADRALDAFQGGADAVLHPVFANEERRLRVQQAICDGRLEGAEQELEAVLAEAERLQYQYARLLRLWATAFIQGFQERWGEVEHCIESLRREYPWTGRDYDRGFIGFAYLQANLMDKARQEYEFFASKNFENVPAITRVYTAYYLARLCAAFDDRKRAGRLYEMLLPYASQNVVSTLITNQGSVSHCLGELAVLLGNTEAVRKHYEDAIRMNEKMGNLVALVETQIAYEEFLKLAEQD